MNKKIIIKLLATTLCISGCATYKTPKLYSLDAPLKGSFDGEWYSSANNQFKIKPVRLHPTIRIRDDNVNGINTVYFDSAISGAFIVCSAEKNAKGYSLGQFVETCDKNWSGSVHRKYNSEINGLPCVNYECKYEGQGQTYTVRQNKEVSQKTGDMYSAVSVFEKNGFLYQLAYNWTPPPFVPLDDTKVFTGISKDLEIVQTHLIIK